MGNGVVFRLAHRERKGHFIDVPAVDFLVKLAPGGRAAEVCLDVYAALVDVEGERLVTETGDDLSAVVVVENHVGHIALVESVTVDNFLVLHAVALP